MVFVDYETIFYQDIELPNIILYVTIFVVIARIYRNHNKVLMEDLLYKLPLNFMLIFL